MTKYVALSGTHGTGKSTLAYKLAALLKVKGFSTILVDEMARECPLPINMQATTATQLWILAAQMKRELELLGRYDYVICDRTLVDTLAYATVLGQWVPVESYLDYVKHTYDSIYLLDHTSFNYQIDDGVRHMDPRFRKDVAYTLIDLYNDGPVSYNLIFSESELFEDFEEVTK
jgi:nicotinamide riboside kinase